MTYVSYATGYKSGGFDGQVFSSVVTSTVFEAYFDSQGQLAGGDEIVDATTEYTLRFDWSPEVPVGYVLIHVDYIFKEDAEEAKEKPIFETGPWYFQDKKLLSARVSWQSEDDSIEVALWGRNLLDKEYAQNPDGIGAENLGGAHTRIDDPVTYGLDLRYSF